MPNTASGLSLVLSGALLSSACTETGDGSQMFAPVPGTWALERGAVNGTCSDALLYGSDPAATFVLDYDGGDPFHIDLPENDAECEMDGTAFSCTHTGVYIFAFSDIDVALQYETSWSGEFSSSTSIVDGLELVTVTCSGSDCSMIEDVPCSFETMFTAEFVS